MFHYYQPIRTHFVEIKDCRDEGKSPEPGCGRPRQVAQIIIQLDSLAMSATSEQERLGYRDAIAALSQTFK